jgi:single-strand DNA-binding protein
MANVNKVILIGRLTRDPEARTFSSGGKVVAFGFAVSNRRKNPTTGQWEDGDPMFIDVKIFNRGEQGRQADLAEGSLRKGHQVYLEGKLVLETWDDKQTGQKRSKHVVNVDNFQFLERREDVASSGDGGSRYQRGPAPAPQKKPSAPPAHQEETFEEAPMGGGEGGQDDIPF